MHDKQMTLDHIGFLTKDVEREMTAFEALLGEIVWSPRIVDPLQDVAARFGRTPGGLVYELIQPLSETSPIARSLKERKNVLNHVCYRHPILEVRAAELRAEGFFPVTEAKPGAAFHGALVQFFYHPNGMMLEIIEGTAGPFDNPAHA
jgi:Glyoxalase/Bleomycin resistance protein/Dioxygenase superfamily